MTGFTGERSRDHTAHTVLALEHFARDTAHSIEFVDRDHIFVGGYLEYAVSRGVDNGLSALDVLFAELLDDLRARSRIIPKGAAPDRPFKPFHQIARKAVRVGWKGTVEDHSGHFPMSRCGVFSR